METMYSQIITKLIEMYYINFINGEELIVNIYDLKEVIDEKFGEEIFKKMINSSVNNLNHVLISSFRYEQKGKQFTEQFNETYMAQ